MNKLNTSQPVNFSSLIEWCPQAFVFADLEGNILFSNPAADKLYGYEREELLGQSVDIFNSKITFNTDEIVEAIKETGNWSGELIQRKKDNTNFFAELSVNLVFENGRPTGLGSYSRDITDKKEAENKLLEQRELLASASKLSSIGEMAAGIAHELNNPLAIITSKTMLLTKLHEKGMLENDKFLEEVTDIKETCERIAKIILGLKAISRDERFDSKATIYLKDILQDSLNLCTEKFKINNINFSYDLKEIGEAQVFARGGQLSQIFLNLLNNAFDAVKDQPEKTIKITSELKKGKIQIFIQDSGKKIETSLRKKIFEPFFTTKEPGKGIGLGLSISLRILEDHKGKISLLDRDQTTFKIELPLI